MGRQAFAWVIVPLLGAGYATALALWGGWVALTRRRRRATSRRGRPPRADDRGAAVLREVWLLGLIVLAVAGCEGVAASVGSDLGGSEAGAAGGGGSGGGGGGTGAATGVGGGQPIPPGPTDSGVHVPDAGDTTPSDAGAAEDAGHAGGGGSDAGAPDAGPRHLSGRHCRG